MMDVCILLMGNANLESESTPIIQIILILKQALIYNNIVKMMLLIFILEMRTLVEFCSA